MGCTPATHKNRRVCVYHPHCIPWYCICYTDSHLWFLFKMRAHAGQKTLVTATGIYCLRRLRYWHEAALLVWTRWQSINMTVVPVCAHEWSSGTQPPGRVQTERLQNLHHDFMWMIYQGPFLSSLSNGTFLCREDNTVAWTSALASR